MEGEGEPTRRRSSLASKKRMTLHLERLAEERGVTPDAVDRDYAPSPHKLSFAPTVASAASLRTVQVEEPVRSVLSSS